MKESFLENVAEILRDNFDFTDVTVEYPGYIAVEVNDRLTMHFGTANPPNWMGDVVVGGRVLDSIVLPVKCNNRDADEIADAINHCIIEFNERRASQKIKRLSEALKNARAALRGDSNDAEHDALSELVEALSGGL